MCSFSKTAIWNPTPYGWLICNPHPAPYGWIFLDSCGQTSAGNGFWAGLLGKSVAGDFLWGIGGTLFTKKYTHT
jgi:hypothetical protein